MYLMDGHRLLRQDERDHRFTISDAIHVLACDAGFGSNDAARVKVGIFPLPSRDRVGLVNVCFDNHAFGRTEIVALTLSDKFRARRDNEAHVSQFSISDLDGATVDYRGIVRLSDGSMIRTVKVVPAKLPLKPSKLDWQIVHHVICIVEAESRCYRSVREHARLCCPDVPPDMLPSDLFIDCSALAGIELPSLKYLVQQIGKRDPALKKLSDQKVADALFVFGMRVPKRRLSS